MGIAHIEACATYQEREKRMILERIYIDVAYECGCHTTKGIHKDDDLMWDIVGKNLTIKNTLLCPLHRELTTAQAYREHERKRGEE